MARPHKEINWDVVEKLIESGCPGTEIAAKFRIQPDTFYIRFKKEYSCSFQDYRGRSQEAGLADLRSMLHAKALNNKAPGNSNILIFLARCKLGMKEPESTTKEIPSNDEVVSLRHATFLKDEKIKKLEEKLDLLEREKNKP